MLIFSHTGGDRWVWSRETKVSSEDHRRSVGGVVSSWRTISTSRTTKDKSWGVVKVDLRDNFEDILKSVGV